MSDKLPIIIDGTVVKEVRADGETLYLNQRADGECDCCGDGFAPDDLVEYVTKSESGKVTITSYLCEGCLDDEGNEDDESDDEGRG